MNLIGNARLTLFKEGWAGRERVRRQKTEVRSQKTEDRSEKSEDRSEK
jgi:hypothetical protein